MIQGANRKILSVYGEGDREAVEGNVRLFNIAWLGCLPSVSPAAIHLPVNGEDLL
jgi:hypothetical protein